MRCCSCMAQICNLKSPSSNLPFCQEKNFFGICKQSVSFTDKEEGGSCAEETTEEDQAWLGLSFLDFQLASARVLLNTATKWEKFYKPFTEWLRVVMTFTCYVRHMAFWTKWLESKPFTNKNQSQPLCKVLAEKWWHKYQSTAAVDTLHLCHTVPVIFLSQEVSSCVSINP